MESTPVLSDRSDDDRFISVEADGTSSNQVLADLARAKVVFQLRTIEMVIRGPVQIAVESMLAEHRRLQGQSA